LGAAFGSNQRAFGSSKSNLQIYFPRRSNYLRWTWLQDFSASIAGGLYARLSRSHAATSSQSKRKYLPHRNAGIDLPARARKCS
jgi:hypothetical protein